ncbi:polypeptide N-acetylgalactosaminyltransferase 5-like [Anneissia japonica]|uniref:polypeptide N-acetylgalactosaminyltransferase 5-like n=1 Tax=Anneissia japonica TaxID=1529436 RepID=UPI001425B776|nr:polypeptide N-acetylgalactosaminyltransferase 5-like [Anneissia japonica]
MVLCNKAMGKNILNHAPMRHSRGCDVHSILDHLTHSLFNHRSPTMAGGLFSIHRDFFKHLGMYDPGFEVWGSENLEISFKIWQCGGKIEVVPCSHVGHIFRKKSPYFDKSNLGSISRNVLRVAEVLLDGYKDLYYAYSPQKRQVKSN